MERLTDWVSQAAGSTAFIALHLAWFVVWFGANAISVHPFDPFPYSLLTLVVSLEAIVLTAFVLMSQNRAAKEADKRAHLDLQVNLLAEQELTAILRIVCALAEHQGVDPLASEPQISQLQDSTDLRSLADELDQQMAP